MNDDKFKALLLVGFIVAAAGALTACAGVPLRDQCGVGAQLALLLTGDDYTAVCAIIPEDVVLPTTTDGTPIVTEEMVAEPLP